MLRDQLSFFKKKFLFVSLFVPGCFLRLEFRDALSCSKPNAKNGAAGDAKVLLCKNSITFCHQLSSGWNLVYVVIWVFSASVLVRRWAAQAVFSGGPIRSIQLKLESSGTLKDATTVCVIITCPFSVMGRCDHLEVILTELNLTVSEYLSLFLASLVHFKGRSQTRSVFSAYQMEQQ